MSVLSSQNIISGLLIKYLSQSTWDVERIQKRLLTGERENDAVSIGIANTLDYQATNGQVALSNLNDGISYLNIADATLEGIQGLMEDVRSLIEEASATTDATERDSLNAEANELIAQSNDLISSAKFGEVQVFYGTDTSITLKSGQGNSGSFGVSVGDGNSIQLGTIDITSGGDPTTELADLDTYLEEIDRRRGVINAGRSRASAAVSYLGVMVGLYDEASIAMRSIDETEEIANLEVATARQETISNLLLNQLDRKESLITQIYASIQG
jgi:flagellin